MNTKHIKLKTPNLSKTERVIELLKRMDLSPDFTIRLKEEINKCESNELFQHLSLKIRYIYFINQYGYLQPSYEILNAIVLDLIKNNAPSEIERFDILYPSLHACHFPHQSLICSWREYTGFNELIKNEDKLLFKKTQNLIYNWANYQRHHYDKNSSKRHIVERL